MSIGYIHLIGAAIIVTCVVIDEFLVKLNSFGLLTGISSGGQAQADIILKYLYLLPD